MLNESSIFFPFSGKSQGLIMNRNTDCFKAPLLCICSYLNQPKVVYAPFSSQNCNRSQALLSKPMLSLSWKQMVVSCFERNNSSESWLLLTQEDYIARAFHVCAGEGRKEVTLALAFLRPAYDDNALGIWGARLEQKVLVRKYLASNFMLY